MPERIPMGRAELSPLLPYIRRAKELEKAVEALRDSSPNGHLTDRFIDEKQPAGPRTYIHAYAAVTSAMEHADALWALLNAPDGGLTPRAPWTLVRSILEAGFWASWILDSDLSYTRRRRGLHVELVDREEERKFINSLPIDDDQKRAMGMSSKSDAVYRSECGKLGLSWEQGKRRPSVVTEIPKLGISTRGAPDLGPLLVATWRSLSGIEHGHSYALLLTSDRNTPIDVEGGTAFRMSVNDDSFILACKAAYALLIEGASLFVRRSTTP